MVWPTLGSRTAKEQKEQNRMIPLRTGGFPLDPATGVWGPLKLPQRGPEQSLEALRLQVIMAALCNRGHYIFVLWFLPFISSPNLSRRRVDVYHTSTHGVALVRI